MIHIFDYIPTTIFPSFDGREWGIRKCYSCNEHIEHCYRMNFWKENRWECVLDKNFESQLVTKAIQSLDDKLIQGELKSSEPSKISIKFLRGWSSLSLNKFVKVSREKEIKKAVDLWKYK